MNTRRNAQKGFSLIEMLVVVSIILIIVGIAVKAVIPSIQAGNETHAAGVLNTVVNAQVGYKNLFGTYSPTMAALGGAQGAAACPAVPTATASCFINDGIAKVLDAGVDSSYQYLYTAGAGNNSYTISATPTSTFSGRKSFWVDSSGAVTYALGVTPLTAPGTPLNQ